MADVVVRNLTKTFGKDRTALSGVSLSIERGEMVALIGASGSGKSTLIRHLAGLTEGDRKRGAGEIEVGGHPVQRDGRLARDVRRRRVGIGVIFQQFNLVSRLTLITNVMLGALGRVPSWRGSLCLFTRREKREAMAALARVGIAQRAAQRASTLSGGEQQRAAIARALVQKAQVILADEPIASLDPASCKRVMETLAGINREDGITVVVSLHQVDYALRYCPRTIALREGTIVYDGPSDALTPRFLQELYGSEGGELLIDTTVRRQQREPLLPAPAIAVNDDRSATLTIH